MAADGGAAAEGSGGNFSFSLWDEKRGEFSSEQPGASFRKSLPDGTWLARVMQGDQASPLIAFTVSADHATEVPLALQPCPPFTMKLVDQHGAPLATTFLTLGIESSSDFPKPCRVTLFCQDGVVDVQGVVPGPYVVEIGGGSKPPFTVRLDLKPGNAPVVVTVP